MVWGKIVQMSDWHGNWKMMMIFLGEKGRVLGSRGEQGHLCDLVIVCLESKTVRLLAILIFLLRKQSLLHALHANYFFSRLFDKGSILKSPKVSF